MAKLVLVGSAPSSGSSMFADLLDSTSFTCCGPELELFCDKGFYSFPHSNGYQTNHELLSIRTTGIFPNWKWLDAFGFDKRQFDAMAVSAGSYPEFEKQFVSHVLSFRNKPSDGIVFEKTPQNLNAVGEFLENSENGHFVAVMRNPLYVFNSLLNRGWGVYTALATWLIYAARVIQHENHERFHLVKLEDVVKAPFQITAKLVNNLTTNHVVSADELKSHFLNNDYREQFTHKLETWEVNDRTQKEIIDPNRKEINTEVKAWFKLGLDFRLSNSYAKRFNLEPISYKEALHHFGYDYLLNDLEAIQPSQSALRPNMNERMRFAKKASRLSNNPINILSDFTILNGALSRQ